MESSVISKPIQIPEAARKPSTHIKIKTHPSKVKTSSKPSKFPFNIRFEHSKLLYKSDSDYPDVIKELKQRGWRDSEIKSDKGFYFLWSKTSKVFKNLPAEVIVNHLQNIQELSQKIKLSDNLKEISNTFFPLCFHIENGNIEEFSQTFQKFSEESLMRRSLTSNDFQLYLKGSNYDSSKGKLKDLQEIQEFLEKIERNDPQFNIRGTNGLWIVKPGWMSRGRGIQVLTSLSSIASYVEEGPWVIQKYIENPLLVNKRKFDIRQWVLVTSTQSISAYFYKRCYLRFSTEEFDLSATENLFVHLTNNSVVKYSKNFKEEDSMWHSEQFQLWLLENYGKDEWPQIQLKIQEIVERTVNVVKDKICRRRNCFELLGYDFMIDEDLNPWLIEVNSSPAMDYSTVLLM
jgi:hypothetical protein